MALPEHRIILIDYNSKVKLTEAMSEIMLKICDQLTSIDEEFDIIAHSLGGILATNIVDCGLFNIDKVVTISSPFGGSDAAAYLKFLYPFTQLFKEISPQSAFLRNTRALFENPGPMNSMADNGKFLPIVTRVGTGIIMHEENDNVVTTKSQQDLSRINFHVVNHNHFEVLMSPSVINKIEEFLWH